MKEIIDAEFEVIRGPDESPKKLPLWKRYHLEWNPWPLIGAAVLGLTHLLKDLQHP